VTFLRARLVSSGGEPRSSELSRAMEAVVDKVRSFGGVVDELSPTGLIAAFGLEPVEDALEHAAFAAIAIQTVTASGHQENPARPVVGEWGCSKTR
jgi:hypothetical protein